MKTETASAAASRVTSAEAVAAVRAHPDYARYMLSTFGLWRGEDDDDRILSQIQWDLGRWLAGVWSMYLDATPGGLTLVRLAALLEQAGVSAGPRARPLLFFMQFIGFIEAAPPGLDRRFKTYRPTPRLRAAFLERFRRDFRTRGVLNPDFLPLVSRLDDPDFMRAFIAALGELTLLSFKTVGTAEAPSLNIISQRYGGMTMLGHLFAAGAPTVDAYPPKGPFAFSMKGVAKRSGVSRTQLRRTLEAGAAAGFFAFHQDGEVELTPLVVEHGELLSAGAYLMVEWAAAQAEAATGRP